MVNKMMIVLLALLAVACKEELKEVKEVEVPVEETINEGE